MHLIFDFLFGHSSSCSILQILVSTIMLFSELNNDNYERFWVYLYLIVRQTLIIFFTGSLNICLAERSTYLRCSAHRTIPARPSEEHVQAIQGNKKKGSYSLRTAAKQRRSEWVRKWQNEHSCIHTLSQANQNMYCCRIFSALHWAF